MRKMKKFVRKFVSKPVKAKRSKPAKVALPAPVSTFSYPITRKPSPSPTPAPVSPAPNAQIESLKRDLADNTKKLNKVLGSLNSLTAAVTTLQTSIDSATSVMRTVGDTIKEHASTDQAKAHPPAHAAETAPVSTACGSDVIVIGTGTGVPGTPEHQPDPAPPLSPVPPGTQA